MARDPRSEDLPEADRLEGAPHPRETRVLRGQDRAERAFLDAWNSGRTHHGWLLTGPRGIGKATLAWRIARFLLTRPEPGGMFGDVADRADTLDSPADHPVARRMMAMAEPRLFVLRRGPNDKGDQLARDITVGEVRRMKAFFALSAADGGPRVAIIDAADELNVPAANALLKLLEEPPAGVTMLLIAHQPASLLPTIRSRCRVLALQPLAPDDMAQALAAADGEPPENPEALAQLAAGSVGAAFRLQSLDGMGIYAEILRLAASMPRLDRVAALTLAESVAGRGHEARFDMLVELVDLMLARLARAGTTRQAPPEAAPGELEVFNRLAPDAHRARIWADLAQNLGVRARQARAVNLDPAALVMDMFLQMNEAAKGSVA